MPPATNLVPDKAEIITALERQTKRWHELGERCWLELRAINSDVGTVYHGRFNPGDLEEAADFAINMNATGRGIYSVRNPIRYDGPLTAAKDTDILAAFAVFADCDDEISARNLLDTAGPRPTYTVITGRIPHPRPHPYWELTEPVRDMEAWRELQKQIARALGSDNKVVNPSRIMRLPGTVTYPPKHKRERGYISELVTAQYPDREPVPFEQLQRAFGAAAGAAQSAAQTPSGFDIDTGHTPMDRALAAASVVAGDNWHDNVIRLVGSYVSRGLSDDEIHAITDGFTLAGYTVEQTRREVQQAIDGARAKGWAPEQRATTEASFDSPPSAGTEAGWRLQSAAEFIADFTAPEYLIDGIVRRGLLYTLTAPTGAGKTAVTLYAASMIAQGSPFCGLETEQGDVIFMAGENPDDVRARVIATLEYYEIDPDLSRLHFIPGTFSIRHDMALLREAASKLPDLALVVVDTMAAYFDGDDDNSNAQMLDFARVIRQITVWPSKPCVIMPAHPVKDVRKDNNVPRGGGAMVNEVDGNLTLWAEGGTSTLHWQRKIRGPDFEPLTLEMQGYETEKIHDAQGRLMPTVIAKPVMTLRAADLARQRVSDETRILQSIQDDPGLSDAERSVRVGLPKSTMQRRIQEMRDRKWLAPKGRKRALTAQGEEALSDGLSGVSENME